MAEEIPKIYGDLIKEATQPIKSGEFVKAGIADPNTYDWVGERDEIMAAIDGANAIYEQEQDPRKRESVLQDILSLETQANDLERQYTRWVGDQEEESQKSLQKGLEYISSGKYKEYQAYNAFGGGRTLDYKKTEANLRRGLSSAFGVPEENFITDTGLPAEIRGDLAVMPTDEDRAMYLNRMFPGQVVPIPQDGKTNFLIREGEYLRLVDEAGGSVGDIVSFGLGVAKEAPALAVSIMTGGPAARSGKFVASSIAGSGGYGVTGGLQDAAVRKAYGLDARPGEIVARRGIEAGMMAGADLGFMGTAKFVARRLAGKKIENKLVQNLMESREILAKEGVKIDQTAGAKFGQAGLMAEETLARMKGGGSIARRRNSNMEQLANLAEAWRGAADPERVAAKTLSNIKGEIEGLAGTISQKELSAKAVIKRRLESRLSDLQQQGFSKRKAGEQLRDWIAAAEEAEIQIQNKNFGGFNQALNESGYAVPYDQAINMIRSTYQGRPGFKAVPKKEFHSIVGEIERLKKADPNGALSFDAMQNLRRKLSNVGGDLPGSSPEKTLAKLAAEDLDSKLTMTLSPERRTEWASINESYRNDRLQFERGSIGRILKEQFGAEAMVPENIVGTLTKYPSVADDVLKAIERTTPDQLPQFRETLKSSYLDSIGLTQRSGIDPSKVKPYDQDMLSILYGDAKGAHMAKKLDTLYDTLGAQKVKLNKITPDELQKLEKALSRDEVAQVTREIAEAQKLRNDEELLLNNSVIAKAKQGNWADVNNGALASAAIAPSTRASEVSVLVNRMKKASPDELDAFSQDFVVELLNNYTAGGMAMNRAPFIQMPNASRFLEDIGRLPGTQPTQSGRELLRKMDGVMGQRQSRKFVAFMEQVHANQTNPNPITKDEIRTVLGFGGVSAYLAEGISGWGRNQLMGVAFGSKTLEPFIDVMVRDVGSRQAEEALTKMVTGIYMSDRGRRALAQGMSRDPEFAARMAEMTEAMARDAEK